MVVAGRGKDRLRWAGELGADRVIDAATNDAEAFVASLNGGYGPDLVIECTGQMAGWQDAFARECAAADAWCFSADVLLGPPSA